MKSLNTALAGSDYTAEEIGNVEHFYVSALLGTLGGPAGGVFLNGLASGIWELVVGPARIAWTGKSSSVVWKNIKHNWDQLTGPDLAGTRFGSFYAFTEPIDHLMGVPTEYDPGPPEKGLMGKHPVAPGDSLSKVAQKWYRELALWPLIFDANPQIGKDYNKIRPGQILSIPDKAKFSGQQIADARKRHAAWRPS